MPLLWLSCSFLAGLLLARLLNLPAWVWAVGMVGGALLAMFEGRLFRLKAARRVVPLAYGLLLAGLCGGALRQTLTQINFDPSTLAWYNGTMVTVNAVVDMPPDRLEIGDDGGWQHSSGQRSAADSIDGRQRS
jgi:hypothetical protein